MIKIFIAALLLLPMSVVAQTTDLYNSPLNGERQDAFNQILNKLGKVENLRGDFIQSRQLKALKLPLKSSGQFLLTQQQGLFWQQLQPFPSLLLVTQDTIKQKMASNPSTELTAKQQPMVFAFSKIFLALFMADPDMLRQHFDLYLKTAETHWQLGLTPKTSPMNKLIAHIELTGDSHINQLTITELKGDVMRVDFSNQRSVKQGIGQDELTLFTR